MREKMSNSWDLVSSFLKASWTLSQMTRDSFSSGIRLVPVFSHVVNFRNFFLLQKMVHGTQRLSSSSASFFTKLSYFASLSSGHSGNRIVWILDKVSSGTWHCGGPESFLIDPQILLSCPFSNSTRLISSSYGIGSWINTEIPFWLIRF